MKVEYQKKFLTQLAKLPADVRTQIEQFVFEELPECSNIGEAGNIEKLSGYLVLQDSIWKLSNWSQTGKEEYMLKNRHA